MITSTRNPTIQYIRKLQSRARARREENAFVIEGVRLVEEAEQAGLLPELVIYTAELNRRGRSLVEKLAARGVRQLAVSDEAMLAASDTRSPQGILAVLPLPSAEMPAQADFLLVLDGVRDPGNLGTILRTAAAGGVDAALLSPDSADPFAPKVLRAGMGAHFRMPVFRGEWARLRDWLAGYQVFLADAHGQIAYTQADLSEPLALIVGGEASGTGSQVESLNARRLRIPMPGGSESLNAAVAAGILIFEVLRQRGVWA